MSNIVKSPPFLFTYWNPFAKDSNVVGSWFDYVKDTSLAKYTADSVGRYIQQASADQINAIDSTGRRICGALYSGFADLQEELEKATKELQGVNQRLDLVLDEARTSNLLQENMAELLRIPDSQKQRHHHIEIALKFLKNALRDEDLYHDALRELLEAEKLMHADYFVLHRIGMIYLYVPALGNLEKAADYFSRAGKYASVESHSDAGRLINILNKKVNIRFAEQAEPPSADVNALAAESFLQAGTALYALGKFDEAAKLTEKAVKCQPNEAKHHFFYAKYLTRSGNPESAVIQLEKAIELVPTMALAALGDCDLNQVKLILDLLNHLNETVSVELQRGLIALKDWPREGYWYADVQQWITDAQSSSENGDYLQKRVLTDKLKEHEANFSYATQMAKITAFGVEFDLSKARQLLYENNPDHERTKWAQRRTQSYISNERLREIAVKLQPDFLELVLLATATRLCFKVAGTICWKADGASSSSHIAIGTDGNVFIGESKAVKALNGSNGNELWEYLTHYHPDLFPVIGGEGKIYVASRESLIALDGKTGKELWKTKANIGSYPAIGVDGTVYANSNSSVCAFDGQTGTRLWESDAKDRVDDGSSPAIAADGTVYAAGRDHVFALNGQTGEKLWGYDIKVGTLRDHSPAIGADGTIYIKSEETIVCALNGHSGKLLWEFPTKGEVNTAPIIGLNGTIYVGTEIERSNSLIYALNGRTGEKLWCSAGCHDNYSLVVGKDGTVYSSNLRTLYALDGQTGKTFWEFKLDKKEQIDSDPVISPDGIIYFSGCLDESADSDKYVPKIYAIYSASCGLADSPWPMRGQNAQRTGCAVKFKKNTANQDKSAVSKEQKDEIHRLMVEAEIAEKMENAKWLRKKDFTRARELYAQAAALGCKEATAAFKRLDA